MLIKDWSADLWNLKWKLNSRTVCQGLWLFLGTFHFPGSASASSWDISIFRGASFSAEAPQYVLVACYVAGWRMSLFEATTAAVALHLTWQKMIFRISEDNWPYKRVFNRHKVYWNRDDARKWRLSGCWIMNATGWILIALSKVFSWINWNFF